MQTGTIPENLAGIEERIASAARRSGRPRQEIQLVAVSKKVPWPLILQAAAGGQRLMGESYIQEARDKIALARATGEGRRLAWHFIGHLQSNKAELAVDLFEVIESVDRLKVARALDNRAAVRGKMQKVLVQVNIGHEPQKSGIMVDDCENLLRAMQDQCRHLRVLGLMAIPPWTTDPEASRPHFRAMRLTAEELGARELLGDRGRAELSMGMSADFEVAIEEGATLVRVGTALFGPRP